MTEDKLKQFIKENRQAFEEDFEGQDLVWDKIESELTPSSRPLPRPLLAPWMGVAAGLALLIVFLYQSREESAHEGDILSAKSESHGLPIEVLEVNHFYGEKLELNKARLSKYEIDNDLMEEMSALEDEFEALKYEMGEGWNDQKVVEAMIDNYRIRLQLLEDLLEVVEKNENNGTGNEIES